MSLPALKPYYQRRHYSLEFKQQLVHQCLPGISVSGIALANGINANLLRRWIYQHSGSVTIFDTTPSWFVLIPFTEQIAISPNSTQFCD